MKQLLKHLKNNQGDVNVSKTTLIAIVFVVGALLLVMTTSAFRNPVNRWFDKVQASWFADENGMFEADNPFLMAERHTNGTIKEAKYRMYNEDGSFEEITVPADLQNGDVEYTTWYYDVNGVKNDLPFCMNDAPCVISPDGKTIAFGEDVFVAEFVD